MLAKIYEIIPWTKYMYLSEEPSKILADNYIWIKEIKIGDVLDWIEKYHSYPNKVDIPTKTYKIWQTLSYWIDKRLPIDQQSDETIKYVYDLLPPSSSNEQ